MIADDAIVRDVRADHQEAIGADRGRAAPARRAAMDGDVLADDAIRADLDGGLLALVAEVLRLAADDREARDARARADASCGRGS